MHLCTLVPGEGKALISESVKRNGQGSLVRFFALASIKPACSTGLCGAPSIPWGSDLRSTSGVGLLPSTEGGNHSNTCTHRLRSCVYCIIYMFAPRFRSSRRSYRSREPPSPLGVPHISYAFITATQTVEFHFLICTQFRHFKWPPRVWAGLSHQIIKKTACVAFTAAKKYRHACALRFDRAAGRSLGPWFIGVPVQRTFSLLTSLFLSEQVFTIRKLLQLTAALHGMQDLNVLVHMSGRFLLSGANPDGVWPWSQSSVVDLDPLSGGLCIVALGEPLSAPD